MKRRLPTVLTLAALAWAGPHAAVSASDNTAPASEAAAEAPPPRPPEKTVFMSVDAIRPGMRAVAYTVFQGSRIEPFTGVVQGIAYNYFGPQRHIVIIRFEGEKLEHAGIVHGMSGSPVYIDGKLVGAVSLALSPFPKDPLAGVTPIAYMLDEAREQGAGPGTEPAAFTPTRVGWSLPGAAPAVTGAQADVGTAGSSPAGSSPSSGHPTEVGSPGERMGAGSLEPRRSAEVPAFHPLLSPLTFSGLDPQVFEHYRSAFNDFPVDVRLGGAGTGEARSVTAEARAAAAATLQPGSPVAGVLVEGDMNLSATGTVTYRDGDQIFAFGHPFLQQGPVRIPMATADVIATVADQTYPFKLSNTGTLVGAITHDRVTAVVGQVGDVPQMMPMRVIIRRKGEPSTTFSYRIVEYKDLTPVLLQIVLANSFKKQWRYFEEGTFFMSTRIRVSGGSEVRARGVYSMVEPLSTQSIFDAVRDVAEPFTALYQNSFKSVHFDGVDVEIDASEESRLYNLEEVYVDRTRIRPGETVEVKIALQRHRGERVIKSLEVPIPPGINGGDLVLRVADAPSLEKTGVVGGRLAPSQARDFQQLVSILNRSRSGERCYVQLLRRAPGLVVQDRQMTTLPDSVRTVLQKTASSEVASSIDRTVLWEGSVALDGSVIGNEELSLAVLPSL